MEVNETGGGGEGEKDIGGALGERMRKGWAGKGTRGEREMGMRMRKRKKGNDGRCLV